MTATGERVVPARRARSVPVNTDPNVPAATLGEFISMLDPRSVPELRFGDR